MSSLKNKSDENKKSEKKISVSENTEQKGVAQNTSSKNTSKSTNRPKPEIKKQLPSKINQDSIFYIIISVLSLIILGLLALNLYSTKKKSFSESAKLLQKGGNSKDVEVKTSVTDESKSDETSESASNSEKEKDKSTDNTVNIPIVDVKPKPQQITKVNKIEKYAIYYGIIDKDNDPKFARYDGEHAFTLFGDGKMFDTELYIVPAECLSNVLLTKQHVYKLYFTDQDIESMTKDEDGVVNVLKKIDHVEDTSLSHVAMGVYHRNAGDEWGPKYESDVYLDLMYYTDDGAVEYVTFIPKTVASPLHLEIGRKYRIGFSFCEQEINDPDIKAYTCSNKAQVLEVK